jgi:hypothetical protein
MLYRAFCCRDIKYLQERWVVSTHKNIVALSLNFLTTLIQVDAHSAGLLNFQNNARNVTKENDWKLRQLRHI